jgi:hypothetical protein
MQSRQMSFIEAFLNTASGFITSLITQWLVFPWFNLHPSLKENLSLTAIFTAVSIVRSYLWRRFFNALQTKGSL